MGTPNDTFENKVNSVLAEAKKDDNGKWSLPDGIDEAVEFSAKAELRRRDTQSAYTTSQQEIAALRKENETLALSYEQDVIKNLSEEDRDRLEELKHSDPEQWRTELEKLETTNKTKFSEKRNKIKESARQETELERRTRLLEEYNEANPDNQLTDEVMENDIPPRFIKELEKGDIDFDTFISKAGKFISTPKKVGGNEDLPQDEPDFNKAGGSHKPSSDAESKDIVGSYKNEIY